MPQPFNNAVMTNAGARLLTRAQAGEIKIEFTGSPPKRKLHRSGKNAGCLAEAHGLKIA